MKISKLNSFILWFIGFFKWYLLFFFFNSVIWAIDLSLRPYLVKKLVDHINSLASSKETIHIAFCYTGYYALWLCITFIFFITYENISRYFVPNARKEVGDKLIGQLLKKPMGFYQDHFAGELASHINNCMLIMPRIVRALNEDFFRYSLALSISIYTVYQVGMLFAIGLAIWVIIYLSICSKLAPTISKLSAQVSKTSSDSNGQIVDILTNIMSVRLFNREKEETRFIKNTFEKWADTTKVRDGVVVKIYMIQVSTFIIFQSLCMYWMVRGAIQGRITGGDFFLVLMINNSIYSSLIGIGRTISDFSDNIGALKHSLKIIVNASDKLEDDQKLVIAYPDIIFEKVQFLYPKGKNVFLNLNTTIHAGQKIGLVGYSGSGKSTFVNLVLRIFNVTQGRILIGGHDIQALTSDSLYQAIAMIPQDPSLFHRSIKENIRYGRIGATDEEVIQAAQLAYAHEFISQLPYGYDSSVGERGVKLSGGQRQRIALARAILKNAPILILDEATSQLDSVTEKDIQESLWKIIEDKTTLVIAHRLSTLIKMDRILVFDQGRIVEDGTHEALLSKEGVYKNLWEKQVGGFLPAIPLI